MKNLIIILVCVLLLASISYSAPLNNKFISSEAKWIIHLDFEAFNTTQLAQCVKDEIKAQGLEPKLEEFKNTFSFNPIEDIKNITLYGKDKEEKNVLMIVQGKWEVDKLLNQINKSISYKKIEYKNLNIHSWIDVKGQAVCGSFFDTGTLVIALNTETLITGLDVLNGDKESSKNKFLLKKPVKGTFLTATAENINNDTIKNELFFMSIGEKQGKFYIVGSIVAKTAEEATTVNQAIVGAIAIFQLNNQDKQPKLIALSKEIEVILKNKSVSVSFEKESIELIKILKEAGEIQKQIEN
jgi:hypothetical protein